MADPIDELVARWRQNPSAAATVALCDALRGSRRPGVVQQIGEFASQRHANDTNVLLSVARMYLDCERLAEAQAVLVSAGKVAPRDADIYRWLGEVLLRRGDAERSEKVLERALQLGAKDGDARLWLERARVFKPMQAKAGVKAVAAEVARAAATIAANPIREPLDSFSDTTTLVRDLPAEARGKNGPIPPRASDAGISPGVSASPAFSSGASFESVDPLTVPASFEPQAIARPPSVEVDLAATAERPATSSYAETAERPAAAVAPPETAARPPSNRPAPAPPPPPLPRVAADPPPYRAPEAPPADPGAMPNAREVLDALMLAGVFEPPSSTSAASAWDRPEKAARRRRSPVAVAVATVLLAGAGVGAFRYVHVVRERAHNEAEAILQAVEKDLEESRADRLAGMETQLGKAFELESRSQRAAAAWIHERALAGLLRGGGDIAFESASSRAREVGVPEEKIAFAQIASFLFQGDTAGAAGLLPKWDAKASGDAWYQLVTGAALERAGDQRARERYAAAAKLDEKLVIAQIALARSVAIDGDAQSAMELAKQFRAKHPDRAEGAALVALAWSRDPTRTDQAPPDADEAAKRAGELPVSLAFVPHAVAAVRAIDKRAIDDAKPAIERALALADGPGVATWIGSIAILAGDEQLARKAALAAVSFSAVYPPARVLAARVALLGDRLDEALKATEDLEASSPDVAVVRSAVAYERLDGDALVRALGAVTAEGLKLPYLQPLQAAPAVLAGKSTMAPKDLIELSDDDSPWADLVTMDLALDRGDLESAHKIAARWKDAESQPLRAVRAARLQRYRGDAASLELADKLSLAAVTRGTVTPRMLVERAFVLVARGKPAEVAPLIAKYPLVLGQLATWLNAYAIASGGKVEDAKGKTSTLDVPPALAPLPARVLGAAALGAMKDKKRGVDAVSQLLSAGAQNPDVVAAALALGFRKIETKGKPARYEAP